MRRSISLILAAVALCGLAPCAAQAQGASLAATVRHGSPRQVREALAGGADPNARLPDGETPLAEAATSNESSAVISALVAAGAKVGAADKSGMTPLMWAAAENPNPDVAAALIAAGANPNARNVIGITPLMFAAKENSNPDVAKRLLAAGAQVNARDINGMTPLKYALADNDNPKLIAVLRGAGAEASPTHATDMTSVNAKYDTLKQRLFRDRDLRLPYLKKKRAEQGRRGVAVEGLGIATAGLAGLFYYLSTTSPNSSQAYRSAAIIGGAFGGGLVLWGTGLLLSRPSQGEINRLEQTDRELDAQLHRLALTKESTSR